MKTKKVILIVIILAIAGAAAYFFIPRNSDEGAPVWIFSAVESGNIERSITATGTIEPVTSVDVGTQVSGIVTSIYVDYNSIVKKGQIIAELDKSTLQIDLDNNKNNLAQAKSELEYQTSNYKRVKELHENSLVADSEYEKALYDYTQSVYAVKSAENNVKRSQINLGYATIYSPIDGVVLSRAVEEGQTVASSYSTPTLFTIAADLTDMQVVADIDEADIGDVKEGQRVTFSVDAFANDVFAGVVTQVRQEGVIESNVVTYEVIISAENPDLKLKPGLTASVEVFTLDKKVDAYVPASALTFSPEEEGVQRPQRPLGAGAGKGMKRPSKEETKVWVKKGDHIVPTPVKVSISNGIITEVEGVIKGDSVVTGREYNLVSSGTTARSPFMQQRGPGRK